MGSHVCLQHIKVLHIDRRGGIWLYIFCLEAELPRWFTAVLYDTSTCTLGLMLCVLKDKAFAFAPLLSRLDLGGGALWDS